MKTIQTTVYSFNELNEDAKETAINNYRNNNTEIFWSNENRQSMEKFAELFPIKITNWSYGGRGEGVSFEFNADYDEIEYLSGQRLATYIWNNYKNEIYTKKYYSICNGRKNCVGVNSKSRRSKIQLDEFGCVFTGFYMDNEILAPIFDFMRKPNENTTFKDLLNECFEAWITACNNDIDSQNTDEYISENLESNDYEYTEDGEEF